MSGLAELGWSGEFAAAFASLDEPGLEPARVAAEHRGRYVVRTAAGETDAQVTGRFRYAASRPADFPAVGDWVAASSGGETAPTLIHAVLPRRSAFSRSDRDGGSAVHASDEQVVAANVDVAFLVAGLDRDLNLRRLERYLALAWSSGAEPVLVLNKADLVPDIEPAMAEVASVAGGLPVHPVSAITGRGIERLRDWLGAGRTAALLGMSGVGKSTIVNALLGEERQATAAVREDDSRGRHTTTHRELIAVPSGGMLLDTPGMRALELFGADEGVEVAFGDIATLASSCRFADCSHECEPDCAVRAAIAAGDLSPQRFESYRKLTREVRAAEIRADPRAQAAEQRRWRAIHKSVDTHMKLKYGQGTRR
jgi:ribosome biogenesis GTPase